MAVGNVTLYSNFLLQLGQRAINLAADQFNVILVGAGYTPAVNTDSTYANVSANEATGTGYTAGGQALTGVSWATSAGVATFTASAVSWPSSTVTAQYAVIVRSAGASPVGTDLLVGFVNLNSGGGPISDVNGTFTITWASGGIFTLSHTP